ncbi:MAG: flagellin [Candidatus Sericytochromatia bacterium]|nr:flagellin [Candidatus Tanganyikabacteria bacterium]
MALRINQNVQSTISQFHLKRNDDAMTASINRLSTGLRVNRSGDDTAALNISERMRNQVRGQDQAASNAQDAHNMLGTAEAALNETHAILSRMRELVVQGASDTLTDSDRTSIQGELDQLSSEVDRIGAKTEWNSHKLLNGDQSGTNGFTIQVGFRDGDIHTIAIRDMQASALSVDASNITVQSNALASVSLTKLDKAIEEVSKERDYLGAHMNGLAQNIATLNVDAQNQASSENKLRDVDFAKEASRLTRAQLLQQSSTAMLAQANSQPQAVLGLLRCRGRHSGAVPEQHSGAAAAKC